MSIRLPLPLQWRTSSTGCKFDSHLLSNETLLTVTSYVFFVFWDIFELGFIYFFYVETKGRTLEELDQVFEEKNPRKASTRKVTVE